MATEQRTTAEQRAALRERYDLEMHPACRECGGEMINTRIDLNDGTLRWRCPRDERIRYTSLFAAEILAAVADADALAAALGEVERYKTALLAVSRRIGPAYGSLEGDGDGYAERMLSKMSETISAALAPATYSATYWDAPERLSYYCGVHASGVPSAGGIDAVVVRLEDAAPADGSGKEE